MKWKTNKEEKKKERKPVRYHNWQDEKKACEVVLSMLEDFSFNWACTLAGMSTIQSKIVFPEFKPITTFLFSD